MNHFFNDKDAQRFGKVMFMFVLFVTLFVATKFVHETRALSLMSTDMTKVSTIDVSGKGEVVAVPDVAIESFTIQESHAKSVKEAQTVVAKKVADAMDFLKKSGVAEKDIQTSNYNAGPEYSYPTPCYGNVCVNTSSAPKVTGYVVSETITVTIRDIDAAGKIVDGLGAAGVTNLSGPEFKVDNTDKIMAEARKKAIDDAQDKAEVLAKDLGVRLVRIVRYSDNNNGGYPMPMYAKAMDMAGSASVESQLPVGQNKYSSNVTITYQIR